MNQMSAITKTEEKDNIDLIYTFSVCQKLEQIHSLRKEWEDLLIMSSVNKAFGSWSWYYYSLQCQPDLYPFLIQARSGKKLYGILPLAWDKLKNVYAFPHVLSDYHDVIARKDDYRIVQGLWNMCFCSTENKPGILIEKLRGDSILLNYLKKADYKNRLDQECLFIKLPDTYDDFLKTKSRRFRKNIKRLTRKVGEAGMRILEILPDSYSAQDLPELLICLNRHRFGLKSCFERPGMKKFVTQLLPDLLSASHIRLFALSSEERIRALDICVVGEGYLGTWNGGFEPGVEEYSPGTLLMLQGIRTSIDTGLQEYDLMRGLEEYKLSWASHTRTISTIKY